MSVSSSGALRLNGDLPSAPPCTDGTCIAPQANTWVRGYPSVLYGIDQCNASTSPRQSPDLRLPAKGRVRFRPISSAAAAYESHTSQVTYDVAYDLWLNASDTSTPCQTDGTLEVMVWTDYDAAALLPDAMKVGTATIPFAVDGQAKPGNASWSVYVSNVYQGGHTAPWGGTVWLVLDSARVVKEARCASISALRSAPSGDLLEKNYGWRDFKSNYWLDMVAFGIEYGPASADPYGDGPVHFSLDLRSYCLDVGATVAEAAC